MTDTSKILIGKIVAAQGLHGEVRVQTFTQHPSDLKTLQIENIKLTFVRAAGADVAICKIDGVNDRSAAESLRGTELFILRESLPQLPDGEYYQADLIGMDVEFGGQLAGHVVALYNFGAGDILELDSGEMISFVLADVDAKNKKIYINK